MRRTDGHVSGCKGGSAHFKGHQRWPAAPGEGRLPLVTPHPHLPFGAQTADPTLTGPAGPPAAPAGLLQVPGARGRGPRPSRILPASQSSRLLLGVNKRSSRGQHREGQTRTVLDTKPPSLTAGEAPDAASRRPAHLTPPATGPHRRGPRHSWLSEGRAPQWCSWVFLAPLQGPPASVQNPQARTLWGHLLLLLKRSRGI